MKTARTRARRAAIALLATAAAAMPPVAIAQGTAYRCGANSYSDQPCEGGTRLKVDDPRTEADRRAAEAATRRAEVRADQLERIRLAQEREAYERDRRAAREARQAAIAERRLAAAEQLAQARARQLAAQPRGASMRFNGTAGAEGKKKKRSAPSSGAR